MRMYSAVGVLVVAAVVALWPCTLRAAGPDEANSAPAPLTPAASTAWVQELQQEVPATLEASRSLLVGKRDPRVSCVRFIPTGSLSGYLPPRTTTDLKGGFPTQLASIYLDGTRATSPLDDFAWHQGLFRLVLVRVSAENKKAMARASALARKAEALADSVAAWNDWNDDFRVDPNQDASTWPGCCLRQLGLAAAQKNLAACKLWSGELASATFALEDLHRWLGFLIQTQLTSLAFQAKCESLFHDCQDSYRGKYMSFLDIGFFPAGYLGLRGIDNYLEVERQAEHLYSVQKDYIDNLYAPTAAGSAHWLPPDVRATFWRLRAELSPAKQQLWDQAPHTPYERSYLANMLFRVNTAQVGDRVAAILRRFDQSNPNPNLHQLMAVLFYRGGDAYAGMEWADRFDGRLIDEAAKFTGTNLDVLGQAWQFTHREFGGFANYDTSLTLRDALDRRKMDCIRATDMIGSLYRNAGRAGFYSVRWSGGKEGHSVAATEVQRDGNSSIFLADGLAKSFDTGETWPEAFFHGHAWPDSYFNGYPDVYAVELTGRGLDSYVWMEGYIVRGPNAGTLMRAAIPYNSRHTEGGADKVFLGPYPASGGSTSGQTAEDGGKKTNLQ